MSKQFPNDLTCPACKHTEDENAFYHAAGEVYKCLMVRIPTKKEAPGFFGIFKQGPRKQLFACPECGIAFIKVDR